MPDLVVVDLDAPTPPTPSAGCDTTLREAIQQARRLLLTGRREERNRLASAITAGAESLDLSYDKGGVGKGSRLSIDLEDFYVWETPTSSTVVVTPSENGSLPADHDDNSVVYVNTKFSDFEIQRAINDVLRELSSPGSGLYRTATVDLTNDGTVIGYDLVDVTDLQDIIEIKYADSGSINLWPTIPSGKYRLSRDSDLTDFPSGLSLTFWDHPAATQGATIKVTYKTSYAPLTDYTDNVEEVAGLHCQAHDLLWIGAAIRLTDSREIARNFSDSQGETRRAGEVPAGAEANSYAGLSRRWQSRLMSEGSRLARQAPTFIPRHR